MKLYRILKKKYKIPQILQFVLEIIYLPVPFYNKNLRVNYSIQNIKTFQNKNSIIQSQKSNSQIEYSLNMKSNSIKLLYNKRKKQSYKMNRNLTINQSLNSEYNYYIFHSKVIESMGQNGYMHSNPIFSEWHQQSDNPSVYINSNTNEQVQKFCVALNPSDQSIFKKRMKEQHVFIVKIHYYQICINEKSSEPQATFNVYTDRIMPIKRNKWQQCNHALQVLKGFRRLSTTFGLMRIAQNMVWMNQKDQIKLWINKNPAINEVTERAKSEQQMLTDITKIIVKYDREISGLLIGCLTLNQAINNIIVNMSEPKTQMTLSSRTLRLDTQKKMLTKNQNAKSNKFRETKQTEDQFPRPLLSNEKRSSDKIIIPNSPKYVQTNNLQQKKIEPGYKTITNLLDRNQVFRIQQKIISEQGSSKHQSTTNVHKRKYEPVEHHQIGSISSILGYNRNSEYGIKTEDQSREHLKESKRNSGKYTHERKSDINRDLLKRKESNHILDQGASKLTKNSKDTCQQQKKKNSKDLPFYDPLTKSNIGKCKASLKFLDPDYRTKTQQFNNHYFTEDNSWNSIKSNNQKKGVLLRSVLQKVPTQNSHAFDKKKINNVENQSIKTEINNQTRTVSRIIVPGSQTPKIKLNKIKSHPIVANNFNPQTNLQENIDTEKREKKQKMQKTIRQQFSNILFPYKGESEVPVLHRQKSNKDILIKQKIQKKKAIFAGLKNEAMKVLMGD